MFTPEQDLKCSRIVKLFAYGFSLDYYNDPIYPGIEA